jgi:hypothetical protein
VHVFLSESAKSSVLHLNLLTVSGKQKPIDAKLLVKKLAAIFAQADIQVVVDNELALHDSPFNELNNLAKPKKRLSGAPTDPEESPSGDPAKLALYGHRFLPASTALNVYIVDSFGGHGVNALSLGTPGPPLPSSYYFGVFVRRFENYDVLARLAAHEIAHFMGLNHPARWSVSDREHSDGLVDRSEIVINLMGSGSDLTDAQIFVLSKSPLLKSR